jgi:SAM-dependent methyltransferase
MAHFQQLRFVEVAAAHMARDWTGMTVLEIGSQNVNGSVRPFFRGADYTGVDLSEGEGVDLVASGHEVALPGRTFDLTISCECFEHNPHWAATFRNMHRMTKDGGIVLVTCASRGRREHGTTRTSPQESPGTTALGWNYYRNLNRSDFQSHFELDQMFQTHVLFRNEVSQDLYFVGKRAGGDPSCLPLRPAFLRDALCATNSLVVPSTPVRFATLLRAIWELPLRVSERLPDPLYQEFAISWTRADRAVRRFWSRMG